LLRSTNCHTEREETNYRDIFPHTFTSNEISPPPRLYARKLIVSNESLDNSFEAVGNYRGEENASMSHVATSEKSPLHGERA
jgi:hypothetical protein